MSEQGLQRALFYLYNNVEDYSSYSDEAFQQFALSTPEKRWIQELIDRQRDGLLLFNQLTRHKQRRYIHHAMPKSWSLHRGYLEELLGDYESCVTAEGARDEGATLRTFAAFLGDRLNRGTHHPRELEFIRFEAVCASVSLATGTGERSFRKPKMSARLRLSLAGDADLVHCSRDVLALIDEQLQADFGQHAQRDCWLFLFRTPDGDVRIVAVTTALAHVLRMLLDGLPLGSILESFKSEPERVAAGAGIERLLLEDVPFVCGANVAESN